MTTKNEIWMDLPLLGGYQRVTPESNPVAWAYAHGSDFGGNLDQARMEAWEEEWNELKERRKDWHFGIPETHWRQRDGSTIAIKEMTDRHLGYAIRFAQTKRVHRSRLRRLTTEAALRLVSPTRS